MHYAPGDSLRAERLLNLLVNAPDLPGLPPGLPATATVYLAASEADFLGVQYLYKSGYDPTSFIDFFEKMLADEKRRPGTMSRLFRSHPPHGSRIRKTQKNIDQLLPSKSEYVVNTSEFLQVKARLEQLVLRRKETSDDPNKPRLRRTSSGGTIPTDDIDVESTEEEEDERPTLKRR